MTVPVDEITDATAGELRWMIDRVNFGSAFELGWLGWQAEMLEHWAMVAVDEGPGRVSATSG